MLDMKVETLCEMPNPDEEMLIICNPYDAEFLLDTKTADCLVIANIIQVGEITVVPKNEFLEYIKKGLN